VLHRDVSKNKLGAASLLSLSCRLTSVSSPLSTGWAFTALYSSSQRW
jgi:hypothetical protein